MEHGSQEDQANATFSLTNEDHTFSNSLRFTLNQDQRVVFCGYSIPHPSEARVNIRVQTTGMTTSIGDPAREALKDSYQELMLTSQDLRNTFDQSVAAFKNEQRLVLLLHLVRD